MRTIYQKRYKGLTICVPLFPLFFLSVVIMVAGLISPGPANADTAAEIDRDVDSALKKLYESTPSAKELSRVAKGVLVFPEIVKGGLIIVGQYGVGALLEEGKTVGYYDTVAASLTLQAGLQTFGLAMFFITDSAIEFIEKSSGWDIDVGPNIVIVNERLAKSLTITTARKDIYAYFFDRKGFMAGRSRQRSKISRITPEKE